RWTWWDLLAHRAHNDSRSALRAPAEEQTGAELMPSSEAHQSPIGAFTAPLGVFGPAIEYMVDAAQRSVLFWDVMRQRGNQYREQRPYPTCSTMRWSWCSTAGRSSGRSTTAS